MSLSSKIDVNTSYTRSINLERDFDASANNRPYIPTSRAIQTLERIVNTCNDEESPRSWALVGPYGSGKSAFALFLSQLFSESASVGHQLALQAISDKNSSLANRVENMVADTRGYCCINLTGSSESLSHRLTNALLHAAETFFPNSKPQKKLIDRIKTFAKNSQLTASGFIGLLSEFQVAVKNENGVGILILIDELGKFLEFESRHRNANDIFLLQAIAEFAHKPNLIPLHFIVLLHQSFDQYFQGMDDQIRNEWKKVQGRFENVPFLESSEQILLVLGAAISSKLENKTKTEILNSCQFVAGSLAEIRALPVTINQDIASTLFQNCYPLHPITSLLLPTLCQKVAQNERTLFTYLGSQEPHGFLDTINDLDILGEELPWIMPWNVYDYFILNQPGVTSDHVTHRRWAEVLTAIDRLGDASEIEIQLIKTIGLLNIIGAQGGFKASKELLLLCWPRSNKEKLEESLEALQKKSLINYRKYSNEYRVWQGSDFDLDVAVFEQKKLMANYSIAEILNDKSSIQPLVARRYAIETGTLRYFIPVVIDRNNISKISQSESPTIYICISETAQDENLFIEKIESLDCSLSLFTIIKSGAQLRGLFLDVVALQRVQRGAPELASDPVSQRELKSRLNSSLKNESNAISNIFDKPSDYEWRWLGRSYKILNKRILQELLTTILKEVYSETPHLHNELINRDKPSSSAMSGRRKLMLAMLNNESLEDLGIEKFPPEKAIYRSILKATGLHQETSDGWKFLPPKVDVGIHGSFQRLWSSVEEFLDETEMSALTVEDFYERFSKPPFGIKTGVLPVIFLAAFLIYKDEIALYEDGFYIPFLTQEILEKLVKSPSHFSVQRVKIDRLNNDLFKKYAFAITLDDPTSTNMMAVVKPLAQFMVNLPEYTKRTKRLSEKTIKAREYFFSAKSPVKLLFNDLPIACGFEPITSQTSSEILDDFSKVLRDVFYELRVAYHSLFSEIKGMIVEACSDDKRISMTEFRGRLNSRYKPLLSFVHDANGLKAFIGRLVDDYGDDEQWINSLATFLARKPLEKWLDEDVNIARVRLLELIKRLHDQEKIRIEYDSKVPVGNGKLDVVLLRAVRHGGFDSDIVVAIDEEKNRSAQASLGKFQKMLDELPSEDIRIALLAQLVENFISKNNKTLIEDNLGQGEVL